MQGWYGFECSWHDDEKCGCRCFESLRGNYGHGLYWLDYVDGLSMDVARRKNVKDTETFVSINEGLVRPAKVAVIRGGLKTRFGVVLICSWFASMTWSDVRRIEVRLGCVAVWFVFGSLFVHVCLWRRVSNKSDINSVADSARVIQS